MSTPTLSYAARLRLYIASPLFSEAERTFNRRLKSLLAPHCDLYMPQEDGGLLSEMIARGASPIDAAQSIFTWDLRAIDGCDAILIVLDGRAVDEGAAFELGYAYASGKLCFGLQTDPRRLLPSGNNPMINQALAHIFPNLEELQRWAERGTLVPAS